MINETLVKAGLSYSFTENKIYVSNFEKWKQISILRRMDFSMPSTTNSLESCHGHLNDNTPRRNTFFTAIYRIVYSLNKQNKEYQRKISHNYNYQIKRTKDEMKLKDPIRIKSEIQFYKTTNLYCNCSSNKLISKQLGINIPCCHQLSLPFPTAIPKLPEINIIMNDQCNYLIDVYTPSQELKKSKKGFEKDEMAYLSNTIKFYSRYKGEEIDSFVDKQYQQYINSNSGFIMNKPTIFLKFIDDGIKYGTTLKNIKKESKPAHK